MIPITNDTIRKDIITYKIRISEAESKILSLPIIFKDYQHKKKILSKKIKLQNEISHIQNLMSIAEKYLE
uniref:Uncharacterized protein n=1 Tax=viral metagenome TaxID=1070528 RepID=A0A6M3JT21_9ZZZZ